MHIQYLFMTAIQGSLVKAEYCVTASDILYKHKSETQRGSRLSSRSKKEENILILNLFLICQQLYL